MNDFERKFKKLLRHINTSESIEGSINEDEIIGDDIGFVKIVPRDYDVEDIPRFRMFCNMIGFDVENEFKQDFARENGYRDYHNCTIRKNENFNKEFTLEELYECQG